MVLRRNTHPPRPPMGISTFGARTRAGDACFSAKNPNIGSLSHSAFCKCFYKLVYYFTQWRPSWNLLSSKGVLLGNVRFRIWDVPLHLYRRFGCSNIFFHSTPFYYWTIFFFTTEFMTPTYRGWLKLHTYTCKLRFGINQSKLRLPQSLCRLGRLIKTVSYIDNIPYM